ncbi:MAG: FAD-dependent monooxygenase [Paludibacteraceae bacterium]|nr:FAD-dependent monooxygenase [Paludibacteraceae bacterium]
MKQTQIIVSPAKARELEQQYRIVKRSVDARQRDIKVLLTVLCDDEGHYLPIDSPIPLYTPPVYQDVHRAKRQVHIIGAGPAGLFAALTLLENGIRPIIYERGKEVSERKKDIALLNRNEGLNAESNYCFGEGGAGTFSDGKLFSRSKKRGNMQRVMEIFHHFGAPDTILYEAHAHIGSDKLPTIIKRMRECIIEHGGEVRFGTRVDESLFQELLSSGEPIILAIGHSAHDTYRMLHQNGVAMEDKGFAMGVRVEHPQTLINQLMYHLPINSKLTKLDGYSTPYTLHSKLIKDLGNASYSLVTQVNGRGVYSFCMCPGGHIVPAGSTEDGCVVNGMSSSLRNSPYANSGIVVELHPEDISKLRVESLEFRVVESLLSLEFQEYIERLAKEHGGPHNEAPAQRLRDFVEGRLSKDLPATSYLPGVVSSPMHEWLPAIIGKRLQQGFRDFDRKYPGFLTNDAVILGVESRSSSAVRIVRDNETRQSISHPNLYPCGEGAGYAGGITSSALDGIESALKISTINFQLTN